MNDASLRFLADERKSLVEAVVRLIREQGIDIQNRFVVMQPDHIRMSRNK